MTEKIEVSDHATSPRLRLLADDLTGALDSAAQLIPLVGSVPTFWHEAIPGALPPSAALDSGTRELDAAAASNHVRSLAPALFRADIAFKKIDSLLRGPSAAEIAACLQVGGFASCIIAPAFPAQGRITRNGRQLVRCNGAWCDTGVDLRAALLSLGLDVRLARPGEAPVPGIALWDAESDTDLARIAAAGRSLGTSLLWCGTGGLAGALAGERRLPPSTLLRPLLGLFGTDHAVTRAQLEAAEEHWLVVAADDSTRAAALARGRLRDTGIALLSFAHPAATDRGTAARRVAEGFCKFATSIPPPRTLVVSGGETLRALCRAIGAASLEVTGQMLPGVPVSLLRGGCWDGVTVVSKSGAFGDADLLRRLVALGAGTEEEGKTQWH